MPSNINPFNINGSFPIAGQDNDSQGFRDNFTNIRTNLAFAKTDIEDLQNKVVLKSALAGGGTVSNNFNGTLLTNAAIKGFREPVTQLNDAVLISFVNGHYQTKTIDALSGHVTLGFDNTWPADGQYAKVRLMVDVKDNTYTMQLPPKCTVGIDEIAGVSGEFGAYVITFPTSNSKYLFEFSTDDGGTTVVTTEVTRKLLKTDEPISFGTVLADNAVGDPGDVAGTMKFDTTNLYICTADYDGTTVIWKKVALASIT